MSVWVQHILLGAAVGFVTAVGVDLHAWAAAPADQPFNFKKALARWIAGAAGGVTLALGGSAAGVA